VVEQYTHVDMLLVCIGWDLFFVVF